MARRFGNIFEILPASHFVHISSVVAESVSPIDPGGQGKQMESAWPPSNVLYVPFGHALQDVAPQSSVK
jgi:hypothetical protein